MANTSGSDTSNRGFASMDEDKQREIASKGGKAAHEKGKRARVPELQGGERGRAKRRGSFRRQLRQGPRAGVGGWPQGRQVFTRGTLALIARDYPYRPRTSTPPTRVKRVGGDCF